MLGHALVLETGMFLLAVGLGAGHGVLLYFALALPRVVSVLVWAASLEQLGLRTEEKLTLDSIQGIANKQPLVTFTLLLAVFSLSGLPGLSGFPARHLLWQGLSAQYPWSAGAALLGSAGLIGAGLRLMRALVLSAPLGPSVTEPVLAETISPRSLADISMTDVLVWAFTGLAALMSVVVGFFPHWFLPFIARIPEMFSQLGR
jgi:NADH:ubiquinone oxidoreductase subunit 2 (subunit N)